MGDMLELFDMVHFVLLLKCGIDLLEFKKVHGPARAAQFLHDVVHELEVGPDRMKEYAFSPMADVA